MNENTISFLKSKFVDLFFAENDVGLSTSNISHIERVLSIKLPRDFIEIAKFFNGNNGIVFNGMYSFDPHGGDWNICDQTIKLRESVKLPQNMIVLAEPDEGIIIMEIISNGEISSKVYWLGIGDAYNLIDEKPLVDNPIIFQTFTDFFSYLLDEEEKQHNKERNRNT
jgi:hypothetical protein